MAQKNVPDLDAEASKALEALVETAVALKRSGMLDMLRVVAEKSGELLALIGNDVATQRALGIVHAAQSGMEKVEPDEILNAKPVVELMTSCGLKAMANTKPEKVKPKGLFGLLGAMRDKDVQVGLALLLEIARNLGACVRQQTAQKK
jgi:uncharacterized protein YjgD (DUF1641 family)